MRALILVLLPLVLLGCPKAEPPTPPLPPTPTLPATTKELPKFELGQLQSDPEIARRNKAALEKGDAGVNLFDKPCEDPAAVKCKP